MNKKKTETIEMDKARNELEYGDVVTFNKRHCVILDAFKLDDTITRYHVFGIGLGVYTVFSNEVKFVEHLDEADRMLDMLGRFKMERTA